MTARTAVYTNSVREALVKVAESTPLVRNFSGLIGASIPPRPPVLTDRVPLLERINLKGAGWRDRLRYRAVPDGDPTHFTLILVARTQTLREQQALWCDAVVGSLDNEIASCHDLLAALDTKDAAAERVSELPGTTAADRLKWARSQRLAAAKDARRVADKQHRRSIRDRLARLESERQHVADLRTGLAQLCSSHYAARASRYTRARTGWLGFRAAGPARIPAFPASIEPGHCAPLHAAPPATPG